MTFLSFFAGIGGFDLGFQQAGMECLGHIEIDPTCQRVLERHWPGKLKGTDVTKYLNAPPRNTPDLICGGFPCQDLSVAGKRKGLAGKRSGLWFAFRDIIANLKPRWVVIENVPGLLSSHEGRDFALLLYGLAELDYRLSSRVLDSQYVGVPQRRRRVFIVGSLGDGSCVEVLFEPESVCGDSPPSRAARQGSAATITTRTGNGSPGANMPLEGRLVEVAGTLGSSRGGFKTTDLDGSGAFIPEVCKTLVGEGHDAMPDAEGRGYPIVTGTLTSNGKSAGSAMQQDAGQSGCREYDDAGTLRSQGPGHDPVGTRLHTTMGVRRLTPRECERLQGFPDDWTRWDAEGKEISDSARYRMIGNAVTATVARWIGKKLVAAHAEKALVTA